MPPPRGANKRFLDLKIPHDRRLLEGEQALSCQSPGGALTACELGNFPLWGNFLTECGLYRARRWRVVRRMSATGLRESPRRRKARNAGDVYRHPRAIYACVSFSQKIFCFAKSFLGALYKRKLSPLRRVIILPRRASYAISRLRTPCRFPYSPLKKTKKSRPLSLLFFFAKLSCSRSRQEPWTCSKT